MRYLALASFLLASSAHADSKPAAGAGPDQAKMKQMMEAAEKAHAPGPQHAWLKTNLAGTWTVQSKAFGPDGAVMPSSGSSEVKPTHGGRFLVEEFTQSRMGMPMTGTISWGYDNMRKKFTSAEIDSVGTGMTTLTGALDEASKTLTLTGLTWSMMLNKEVPMRLVLHVDSDKKHTVEIFGTGADGKEVKRLELSYARK
jgi:hypothetical protein